MPSVKYISFERLFHVGQLDPLARRSFSLEGNGLSVSEAPESWRVIARCGNSPTWVLTKPENKFLDWYALTDADHLELEQWGIRHGFVLRGPAWRVDEDDSYRLYSSRAEAQHEDDGGDEPTELSALYPTPLLIQQHWGRFADMPLVVVPDMLALAYACAHGADGVHWDDALNVSEYSAPRAVISQQALDSWKIDRTD